MSETTDHQKRPPVGLSLLSMLFGSLVGAVTYFHFSGGLFCSSEQVRGANIDHAFGVAFLGGLAGSVLILFVRKRRRLLAAVLLLGAAALGVAIAFVALDSATYTAQRSCGLFTGTETAFNDRVYYLYVLWGAPLGFLLWAALQGLLPKRKQAEPASSSPASPRPSARRPTRRRIVQLGVITPAVALAAWAVIESGSRPPKTAKSAAGHPDGVLVCRNPFRAPEALGGPWVCENDTDIGTSPIAPPTSLMCSTDLSGVKNKTIGVQVFYGTTLIKHGRLHSSDSETSPYAEFDGDNVDGVGTGTRLPIGRYRCRFLVNANVARSRTVTVGLVRLAKAPLQYHYTLDLRRARRAQRVKRTHFGDELTVVISSQDLPHRKMVRVELCVNHVHGEDCQNFYLAGGSRTSVAWDVDRGEGVGKLYRLSIRVQGRRVAHRDLRLVRRA